MESFRLIEPTGVIRKVIQATPMRGVAISLMSLWLINVGSVPAAAGPLWSDLSGQLEQEAGGFVQGSGPSDHEMSGPMQHQSDSAFPAEKEKTTKFYLRILRGGKVVEVVEGDRVIRTFPVSVGKPGWETPLGTFHVIQLEEDPVFRSPFDLTDIRPSGAPNNPLGPRWIGFYQDNEGIAIGFHGTNLERLQPSHGCVRMHNADVKALFQYVSIGTVVKVVP